MLSKTDIEYLRNFRSGEQPVVSLYLDTDGKSSSRKEVETRLKEMGRLARLRLEGEERREFRKSALDEIHRVEDHILKNYREFDSRGMALFCSGDLLWHVIDLPRPPRDRFVIGESPYLRPLQFQELEYHRLCTVLLDRSHARIYLVYKGVILEYKQVDAGPVARLRRGGREGYDAALIDRRTEEKTQGHFHNVANTLFELFKRDQFEWLIVACKDAYTEEFRSFLHAYLKDRFAAQIDLPVDTPEHEVLDKALRVEQSLVFKDHCRLVERLRSAVQGGGMAVQGLPVVLRHMNAQAVETLLVSREFVQAGYRCQACPVLSLERGACPSCGAAMTECSDLVTETIDRALDMGCEVRQVYDGVGLDEMGRIGALLRFRI